MKTNYHYGILNRTLVQPNNEKETPICHDSCGTIYIGSFNK